MIQGFVDEQGPKIEIVVTGMESIAINVIIDTGFDGDICLPIQIAIQLGLKLKDVTNVELADGTIKRELVFAGLVKLGDEEEDSRIILTESKDAVMGTGLLHDRSLKIDFLNGKVSIE
jgi:clan AA aspartic protease